MNRNHKYPSKDPMSLLEEEMKLRGFSQKTIKSYTQYITRCLEFANKSARDINTWDVRGYLANLAEKGYSSSTLNLAYSALQFYFGKILHRNFFVSIPRAKKDKKLPVVLSKEEINKMIEQTKNIKHKTIIKMLYGTGMRVGELVRLRMNAIDFDRRIIHIVHSKGAKDRVVLLPGSLVKILHIQKSLKRSKDFLFTNGRGGRMTEASIQKIIKYTAFRAGVGKLVSPHTMRHSFATHLLESGTDIRYIQALLGHARLETTQIYTKVAVNKLEEIVSPLDCD